MVDPSTEYCPVEERMIRPDKSDIQPSGGCHMVSIFDIAGSYPVAAVENETKLPPGIYDNRIGCAHSDQFMEQTQI